MSPTFQHHKTMSLHIHQFLLNTDLETRCWMEIDTLLSLMWCECQSLGVSLGFYIWGWIRFLLGLTGHRACLTSFTTLEVWILLSQVFALQASLVMGKWQWQWDRGKRKTGEKCKKCSIAANVLELILPKSRWVKRESCSVLTWKLSRKVLAFPEEKQWGH